MIRATASIDGPPFSITASVRGLAIYLDNWAVYDLAERDPSRRKRFVSAIWDGGGDLLFSIANAVELSGPQGNSFEAVKSFLDEIGANWFPVELDVFEVMQREQNGAAPDECCVAEGFMRTYVAYLAKAAASTGRSVVNLSGDFFRLGGVLDWLGPQRDEIRKTSREFDEVLKTAIRDIRVEYERDPRPPLPFHPSRRATFACVNLVRTLIVEAKSHLPKKGDAMDFSHAVTASAYASVAALDMRWKNRVEGLPKPNGLARIFGPHELDRMVSDVESLLKQLRSGNARSQ